MKLLSFCYLDSKITKVKLFIDAYRVIKTNCELIDIDFRKTPQNGAPIKLVES